MEFEIRDFRIQKENSVKATATVVLRIGQKPILSIMEAKLIEKRNGTLLLCMPGRYAGKPFLHMEDSALHNQIQRALIRRWTSMSPKED